MVNCRIYVLISSQFEVLRNMSLTFCTCINAVKRPVISCHVTTLTGTSPMTSTADVRIHVGDKNDNPPTFDRHPSSQLNTTYLVSTRAQRGYVITRLRTSDADSGINARVTFQLADVTVRDVDTSASGLFHVDRDLGIVSVAGGLSDRDGVTFDLIVVAMDGGEPPMSAFTTG